MPDFPIIDAHVHLYDPAEVNFDWLKDIELLNKAHLPEYYQERTAPVIVDGLVFVEVDAVVGEHVDEAIWVNELAREEPRVQGIVASAPLERGPGAVESDIASIANLPLARGVRRLIQNHSEPGWCLEPAFVESVKLLPKYDLTFDICIFHPQLGDAIELVKQCPDVQFMLDHIGKPGIRDGIREPWFTQIAELAIYPNVMCKISGVVTEADHGSWTYDHVAPYVARAIEVFGFDRVAFGGDWPVSEMATTYENWVATVDRVVAGSSEGDLRKLYRDNAIRFYRL